MAVDYLAFDDENQARLRDQISEAKKVLAADDIEDAITKHENAPLLCTVLPKAESDGPLVASKTNIDQREELSLFVVIVAESFRDKAERHGGRLSTHPVCESGDAITYVEKLTSGRAVRVRPLAVHGSARITRRVSGGVSRDGARGFHAIGLRHSYPQRTLTDFVARTVLRSNYRKRGNSSKSGGIVPEEGSAAVAP